MCLFFRFHVEFLLFLASETLHILILNPLAGTSTNPFLCLVNFFFFFNLFIFIYLWLGWVFVSLQGLSLVVASGGHSSSRCAGLSPSWPL